VGGSPNASNSVASKVVISATFPSRARITSILKARYVLSPNARR
jgi:hypothetical protein